MLHGYCSIKNLFIYVQGCYLVLGFPFHFKGYLLISGNGIYKAVILAPQAPSCYKTACPFCSGLGAVMLLRVALDLDAWEQSTLEVEGSISWQGIICKNSITVLTDTLDKNE